MPQFDSLLETIHDDQDYGHRSDVCRLDRPGLHCNVLGESVDVGAISIGSGGIGSLRLGGIKLPVQGACEAVAVCSAAA